MTTTRNTQPPVFSDAAVAIWNLQNEADALRGVATMGETVSAARFVLRCEQAEAAQTAFATALNAATPEAFADYLALLRFRATL